MQNYAYTDLQSKTHYKFWVESCKQNSTAWIEHLPITAEFSTATSTLGVTSFLQSPLNFLGRPFSSLATCVPLFLYYRRISPSCWEISLLIVTNLVVRPRPKFYFILLTSFHLFLFSGRKSDSIEGKWKPWRATISLPNIAPPDPRSTTARMPSFMSR